MESENKQETQMKESISKKWLEPANIITIVVAIITIYVSTAVSTKLTYDQIRENDKGAQELMKSNTTLAENQAIVVANSTKQQINNANNIFSLGEYYNNLRAEMIYAVSDGPTQLNYLKDAAADSIVHYGTILPANKNEQNTGESRWYYRRKSNPNVQVPIYSSRLISELSRLRSAIPEEAYKQVTKPVLGPKKILSATGQFDFFKIEIVDGQARLSKIVPKITELMSSEGLTVKIDY